MMWGDGWGMVGPLMAAGMVALVVLVVWAVRTTVARDADPPGGRRRLSPGVRADDADDAMSILRQRFANGEIDVEEFEQRAAPLLGLGYRDGR